MSETEIYLSKMEEPMIEKSPPTNTSTKRLKKKSVVAKLAEKRRLALLSDAESEFGSRASVQGPTNTNTTNQLKVQTVTKSETNGENVEFIKCSTKDPNPVVVHRDKPRPKPRKRAKSSEQCISNENIDVNDKTGNDDILKGSQTDSTLHRFRNLRMATERTESVESLKTSPFVPKPPSTPRPSRGSAKGEKRIRDHSSSGEEADAQLKKSLFSSRPKNETNNVHHSNSVAEKNYENGKQISTLQKDFPKKICPTENIYNSLGRNNSAFTGTLGSVSDLQMIAGEYEHILESDSSPTTTRTPAAGRANSQSSVSKDGHLSHNAVKTLPPLTPNTRPPPLPNSFSSKVLRTTYKSDPLYYARTVPNTSDHSAQSTSDNQSQKSFTSTSVLQSITTKEVRMRLVGFHIKCY